MPSCAPGQLRARYFGNVRVTNDLYLSSGFAGLTGAPVHPGADSAPAPAFGSEAEFAVATGAHVDPPCTEAGAIAREGPT